MHVAISINFIYMYICTPYWFQTTPLLRSAQFHHIRPKAVDQHLKVNIGWILSFHVSHHCDHTRKPTPIAWFHIFSILCYLPKELRKSEIFLMLPVITSMYSRLAQSCWIGLWWLWIWPWLWGWCDIVDI